MKRKFINLLFVITVIKICYSCKKDINEQYIPVVITENLTRNIDSAKLLIQGNWQWIQTKKASFRSGQYIYTTPQTENYSLLIIFSTDTCYLFKNNSQTGANKFDFKLRKDFTNIDSDSMPVLVTYAPLSAPKYIPYLISKNYLILQGQYAPSNSGEVIYKIK